ncbi:MAG: hypothetical protein ABJB74_01430 [Gemmatimonas sp.]
MLLAPQPEPRQKQLTPIGLRSSAHINAPAADSVAAHSLLVLRISEFQIAWQEAWERSEMERWPQQSATLQQRRKLLAHCHPDNSPDNSPVPSKSARDSIRKVRIANNILQSHDSWYAVCPTWLLDSSQLAPDGSAGLDGELSAEERPRISELRQKLIQQLDDVARQYPRDGFLPAILLRFKLDQRDTDGAMQTVQQCGADKWWCQALLGYLQHRLGQRAEAEKTFLQMTESLSSQQRCKWDEISVFANGDGAKAYQARSCAEQATLNETFWWLTDPLYRVAGNERFVDHQARRVEMSIRELLAQDERHSWADDLSGGALQMLMLRYGMPALSQWATDSTDIGHNLYLTQRDSPENFPYTTFEYATNRVHTAPQWSTTLSPFTATINSWDISEFDSTSGKLDDKWWPAEHFTPLRPLVQFRDGQIALFRRQSRSLLAAAADTRHPAIADGQQFDVLMLRSTKPNALDSMAHKLLGANQTLAMRSIVPQAPAIVSIEAQGIRGTEMDARLRFGVVPPPPLDSMKAGELTMSDIAFIDIRSDSVTINRPNETLLDHMMGSLHFDKTNRRVGLYWESYGASASEEISVSVRIGTIVNVGTLQRIRIALRVSDDPRRSISQTWREPDENRGTRTLAGSIPTQQRTLSLNLSQLDPGEYALEITLQRPNGKVASTMRRFVIDQ